MNSQYKLNLEMKETIRYMKDKSKGLPQPGDNVIKFAKSVLVCCKCQTQVEVYEFYRSGLPKYRCVSNTCPAYLKDRNKKQRSWLEYLQEFEYRKVGVIK